MGKRNIIILVICGVLIALGFIFYYQQRPLAIVGDTPISKKDAKYRDQLVLLSFPEEKRSLGLFQLIKSTIHYEILKKHGISIQEAQLQAEVERIDKNTKDPEHLKKIKNIFANDQESYLRVFILPNIVDHMIYYDFFLKDESIHQESLNTAAAFIAKVKDNPKQFRLIADQTKVPVRSLTLSLTKGMLWETDAKEKADAKSKKESGQQQGGMKIIDKSTKSKIAEQFMAEYAAAQSTIEEAKKWHELVIQFMKDGEVTPAPLNREEEWVVIHMVKQKSKDEYQLEVAFFKKLDFSQWLEAEKQKIPVKILDAKYVPPK